ncbi:NAD-dependent succinate-semialdehyde dehydrogenase [Nocardioides sp. 503]|uniref:NAD-dependent succinate-semialdehyde dehydrogenase n=1 Tax=Nocardioides sp. 503 TaxID=2508326 RepID=UPI00106F3DF2|nr:NAD-dependent succinate-semialdehyde dehydrogenase [Nocardioides sp. 503]
MTHVHAMLIDGDQVAASDGAVVDIEDPATGEVIASTPRASAADLDRALASSATGWEAWKAVTPWERSGVLRRAATLLDERTDEIATMLTREQGKPLAEARAELQATVEQFDWYADEARRIYGRTVSSRNPDQRMQVLRQPIGPVAAFTPWNFPVLLAARKVAPALAAGCSVVLKPAEEAPGAALAMATALTDAGLPPGVLNVVTGDPAAISEQLIGSSVIRKVSLTGSVPVGRHLLGLAAQGVKNVSMELGGHAPVLVFGDADPELAGRLCAAGKFRNAGQVCIAATRFYVQDTIAEAFLESFTAATAALTVGSGLADGTDVGPLASARGLARAGELVEDAVRQGAQVRTGGHRVEDTAGYFYTPTVLSGVPESAAIMQTEPFGPIAPVATFATFDEAIARANGTPYGLAGYLFSDDLTTATRAAELLEVGIVGVNTVAVSGAQIPFGGIKESGIGAENGTEALEGYLHSKAVVTGLRPRG